MKRLLAALGADEGADPLCRRRRSRHLLGLPISDIDLATRLSPEEVVTRLEKARIKAVPTGIDHGTITAVSDGSRSRSRPCGGTSRPTAAGRRSPSPTTGSEDAARRDFTINALSADPVDRRRSVDYFGGLDDLAARHVRFIGDPLQRIAEDHLRILRFFRFHARFGARRARCGGAGGMQRRAPTISWPCRASAIADELLKLLALPDPAPTVALMAQHDILACLLPEADDAAIDRLTRLVAREQAHAIAPDPLRRLAALLPRDAAVVDAGGGTAAAVQQRACDPAGVGDTGVCWTLAATARGRGRLCRTTRPLPAGGYRR